MNLELRNIKVHLGLSEETYAYTARLFVDGKPAADISNQGHGGCDMEHPIGGFDLAPVFAFCKSQPKVKAFDMELEFDLEQFCSNEVSKFLAMRDMKRAFTRKVLFLDPDKKGVREVAIKGSKSLDPKLIDHIRTKYPQAKILNTMPEADALALYSATYLKGLNR